MSQSICPLGKVRILQLHTGECEPSRFWLRCSVCNQPLSIALDCLKISSFPSFVNPLFSAFSNLALIQSIRACCFLACRTRSLTNSLLLEYSWLSTCVFNHSSLGLVKEMLCLAISIHIWCKNTPNMNHFQIFDRVVHPAGHFGRAAQRPQKIPEIRTKTGKKRGRIPKLGENGQKYP